jgi:hypothetical protein
MLVPSDSFWAAIALVPTKLPDRAVADHPVAVKSLPLMIANEPLRV